MTKRILYPLLLLVCGYSLNGCIAVRQRKSWQYRQLSSKTEPTAPFIEINLEKPVIWLPLPLVLWEISTAKNYLLDIDFHTKNIEYQRLDSIGYRIQNADKQLLASGILPIVNGELSERSYSPGRHRAQCTTRPLIVLGHQHQALTGSFVIYATDVNNRKALIPVEDVALHYFKARIGSFF
ncbi:hypothetical protein [Hymenobacter terrestris]|uniref:Gliding motility lipoprotein GldD n=1 Tax=Hymenobacter terrestris TaxID=2748310 RepID=A0ABX2Q613_9BACT|nr:hypothetical protein [Hymenobacter terrestris]NVO86407.1 hypothetical protein [Hymenobacter terrestris]